MSSSTFNAIDYVNGAIEAGFTREQAEYQVKYAIKVSDILATKTDLKLTVDDLKNEMKLLESRLTVKLGTMMVAMVGVLTFLLKH